MRRLFVLDTNVLMHDPTAIFRFEEHDIYLPMVVLEELDANKKGLSEASRNARQVSRFLDDMMRGVTKEQIDAGLPIPGSYNGNHGKKPPAGRLFFQTQLLDSSLPDGLPGHGADNAILADTLALQRKFPQARVIGTGFNLGYGRANNLALLDSPFDYYAIINSDLILHKGSLDRCPIW